MPEVLERLKAALADRYAIERELGSGGMATVYLALDLRYRHRHVAIKVLKPELAMALGPDRFLREIEIAARLTHPHILALLDSGNAEGLLYYVMPFTTGETARQRLEREGEFPILHVTRILNDVLEALSFAHAAGVIHRDIKPENVLLTGRHALVIDFGLAKALSASVQITAVNDGQSAFGMALGTPEYMSPEQSAGHPSIDHRTDIYAVGAMAYELLAGQPPFTAARAEAVLSAQIRKQPAPLSEHRKVPPVLEELVMRCLAKRPIDRWQSADEMIEQLARMPPSPMPGGSVASLPPASDAPPRAAPRRPVWWRIALLLLLFLLMAMAFWLVFARSNAA